MDLQHLIESRITAAFQPTLLQVIDESDAHHGHAAHAKGARHFAIKICASCFDGITRIEAHRKIYVLFADIMPHPLHALKIEIKHT